MTDTSKTIEQMVADAVAAYVKLSPADKAKHNVAQQQSFVRGMCPSKYDYREWCDIVDRDWNKIVNRVIVSQNKE